MHKHKSNRPPKYSIIPCPDCGGKKKVVNGQWLKFLREEVGLDQRAFASGIGISGPYISDIERNRRDCPSHIFEEYLKLKYIS